MKGDNKKTISEEFFMEDDWDSTNEKLYMQNILDQSWIKKSEYLNIEQLKNNLPSFHYFDKHCSSLESLLP